MARSQPEQREEHYWEQDRRGKKKESRRIQPQARGERLVAPLRETSFTSDRLQASAPPSESPNTAPGPWRGSAEPTSTPPLSRLGLTGPGSVSQSLLCFLSHSFSRPNIFFHFPSLFFVLHPTVSITLILSFLSRQTSSNSFRQTHQPLPSPSTSWYLASLSRSLICSIS